MADEKLNLRHESAVKLETDHREYHGVVRGKFLNPLSGIPRAQIERDVELFVKEKNLAEHLPLFKKAALLSQSPHGVESIDLLTEEDRDHIRYEHAHNVGAATQGWDQTGSNGANLSFPVAFGIPDSPSTLPNAYRNSWIVGVVNAAPYLSSALVGCWLADPLNNWFGRRGCIFITAVILILTPIGSGFSQNWEQLLVCRLLLGLGMGAKGATVPVFAAENAPAAIRGTLVMGWQMWTAFGIFLGFAANVVVANVTSVAAWRLQLGSAFIPAVPLAVGIFFCPESPRWLIKKNRYTDAFTSLKRLRHHELQAARDLYTIHVVFEEEKKIIRSSSFITRAKELFTIPRVRRATVASGVVMLAQQMCGINIIAFYSSTIFKEAGYTDLQALYASLGFGATNFLFAFPALFTIDHFGRRTLLLFTFPHMCWTLLAAGLCFLIPDSAGNARIAAIALFVFLFAAFYSPGEGPVPFTYSAEVFPLANREMGMAWAVTVCFGFSAILSLTFPSMLRVMTATGAFGFYAGLNAIAFVMIFLLVPETKQRTLEELDGVFSIPTGTFIKYNMTKTLPYYWHRFVLMKKDYKLAPLYEMEGDSPDGIETPPMRNLDLKAV